MSPGSTPPCLRHLHQLQSGRNLCHDQLLSTFWPHCKSKLAEEEPLLRERKAGDRRTLGDERPGTLASVNNLPSLLNCQEKLAEAELLLRETVEARRRMLGDEHPNTLASVNIVASLPGQSCRGGALASRGSGGKQKGVGSRAPWYTGIS